MMQKHLETAQMPLCKFVISELKTQVIDLILRKI